MIPASQEAPTAAWPRKTRRLAIASIVVIWVSFHVPAFGGRVLFPVTHERGVPPSPGEAQADNRLESDAYTLYYPLRSYLGERLREGDIPLWDPHRFSGLAFAANSQAAVWYPPNWLFAAGNTVLVYSLLTMVMRLGGMALAYWFFRVLGLHPYAAVAGATIFVYSGFLVAWAEHTTFLASAMWLPLALGGLTLGMRGRPRLGVPLAAVGLALSVLGGHPQVTIYVWFVAAVWGLVWGTASVLTGRRGRRWDARLAVRPAAVLIGAYVAAVGLASLQILSSLEFSEEVLRGIEPYDGLIANSLRGSDMTLLFLPDVFGNPLDVNYTGASNYTETAMYAGIFSLVLALVALFRRWDRVVVAFAILAAIGALAALGTPFYRVLYEVVPGLSRTRGITRFVFVLDVALAGLAAVGMHRLLTGSVRRALPLVATGVVASAGAVSLAAASNLTLPPRSYLILQVGNGLAVLVLGLLAGLLVMRRATASAVLGLGVLAVAAGDLWLFGFRYHPFHEARPVYVATSEIRYLASRPGPRPRFIRLGSQGPTYNAALVHGLYDAEGYDNFIPRAYIDLISIAQDQHRNASRANVLDFAAKSMESPVMDLLGVESVTAVPDSPDLAQVGQSRRYDRWAVADQAGAIPPAFVATCWEVLPEGQIISRVGSMTSDDLGATAIIQESAASETLIPAAVSGECSSHPATLRLYEPERVEIDTVAPRGGILVLTDAWDDEWEATVDGKATPVLQVDRGLRGVSLGPGSHRVVMTYRPGWLGWGAIITAMSALLIVGYGSGVASRLSRRRG